MVYECEHCGTALPPGVSSCPMCHQAFDEAVPTDAEVRTRGWQTQSEEKRFSQRDAHKSSTVSSGESVAAADASSQNPGNPNWNGHVQSLKDLGHDILRSPTGQKLNGFPIFSRLKSWLKTGNGKIAFGATIAAVVFLFGILFMLRVTRPLVGAWVSSLGTASITLTYSPLGTFREVLIQPDEVKQELTGYYSDDGAHVLMQPQIDITLSPDGSTTTENGPQKEIGFSYVISGNTMTIINNEGTPVIYVRQ